MELYAIVDEDLQVAKHRSKGTLAVFKDLEMLKNMLGDIKRVENCTKLRS